MFSALLFMLLKMTQCDRRMHTRKPRDLTITLKFWGSGPQSKAPHKNTGNDISYILQDTRGKRARGEERQSERVLGE